MGKKSERSRLLTVFYTLSQSVTSMGLIESFGQAAHSRIQEKHWLTPNRLLIFLMPTDSDLRQTAIDTLCKELKKTRPGKVRCEIALAVLTEMREAREESEPADWQDFIKEEYARTAIQLELEHKMLPR